MFQKIYGAIFISLGFLCIGLGCLGVFLPVLPTTPFMLLAAFFLARGSKKFHRWFVSTGLYKKHLNSFVESRSMTLKDKIRILSTATLMLALSFLLIPRWPVRLVIGLCLLFIYYYFFFRIRTIKEGEKVLTGEVKLCEESRNRAET